MPPLILKAWWIKYDSDRTKELDAISTFLKEDRVKADYDDQDFERQMLALVQILFLSDTHVRTKWGFKTPRSIFTVFGCDKKYLIMPAGSRGEVHQAVHKHYLAPDKGGSFHVELEKDKEIILGGVLPKTFNDEWDTLEPWTLHRFESPIFAGVDMVVKVSRQDRSKKDLFLLIQCKWSKVETKGGRDHYESLNSTLEDKPNITKLFKEGQVCFVVLAHRDSLMFTDPQFNNVCQILKKGALKDLSIEAINELVGKSLVFVNRCHLRGILGPTLSSIVQFNNSDTVSGASGQD